MPDIACSTTPQIPGRTVDVSKGLVCGEAIMGANILRDLVAGITDIVGGRSGAYEGKLRESRTMGCRGARAALAMGPLRQRRGNERDGSRDLLPRRSP